MLEFLYYAKNAEKDGVDGPNTRPTVTYERREGDLYVLLGVFDEKIVQNHGKCQRIMIMADYYHDKEVSYDFSSNFSILKVLKIPDDAQSTMSQLDWMKRHEYDNMEDRIDDITKFTSKVLNH